MNGVMKTLLLLMTIGGIREIQNPIFLIRQTTLWLPC